MVYYAMDRSRLRCASWMACAHTCIDKPFYDWTNYANVIVTVGRPQHHSLFCFVTRRCDVRVRYSEVQYARAPTMQLRAKLMCGIRAHVTR